MKTIRISDEVWIEIARRGRFGEKADDVLKRILNIRTAETGDQVLTLMPSRRPRRRLATRIMSARVVKDNMRDKLFIRFLDDNTYREWPLPQSKEDKENVRRVFNEAIDFGRQNGATNGQLKAIMKSLNLGGYYILGPRPQR